MVKINLSSNEEIIYKDFRDGNPVQVRVTVRQSEEVECAKGKTVKVVHGNLEANGKIVSDPLVVGPESAGEDRTISLIIEKVQK